MTHEFPFDPTYGYDEARLRGVSGPDSPTDFAAFWLETYQRTRATAPRASMRPSTLTLPGRDVYDVEFDGLDGFRVGAWLTLPESGRVTCGFTVGHGYGGRSAPDAWLPVASGAGMFICSRGFDRSARPDLPGVASAHVLHGIELRDTYLHRFCVADRGSATSALVELVPEAGAKLFYSGTSFGGGLGALATPWETRWSAGYLDVPSFGHHPLRVTLPCIGSGEAVRNYLPAHPEVMQVLAYHDAAIASRHSTTPTFVAAALFDPAVPPPGQFAVYNALCQEKSLFVRQAAHYAWPGQASEERHVRRALEDWFAARMQNALP